MIRDWCFETTMQWIKHFVFLAEDGEVITESQYLDKMECLL